MKKEFFLFILLLIFVSCNRAPDKKPAADSVPHDTLAQIPMENETTALAVDPAPLPAPFILDTLSVEDTALHMHAFFHFPVSDDKQLNNLILKLVKKNTNGYEDYHPGEFDEVSIEAWVSSFAITKSLVSMCFTDQSFTSGAAHFNHGYTCLNYNTDKHRQVFLTDIFNLQTAKQKQDFCNKVLSTDMLQLFPEDLKKETDFTIEKGNIIFYFDDYEKEPSMTSILAPMGSLRDFIKKDYQWLID